MDKLENKINEFLDREKITAKAARRFVEIDLIGKRFYYKKKEK